MSGKWDKWYYYKPTPTAINTRETEDTSFEGFAFSCAGVGILGALAIIAWQTYAYLKLGEWTSLTVITALRWCKVEWSMAPSAWLGVHKILETFPLSLACFLIGMVPFALWSWWDGRSKQK